MNKFTTKTIVILLSALVVFGGIIFTFRYSNYQLIKASKSLITAIETNDLQAANSIIKRAPKSVNTLPSIYPYWWQYISEQPEVLYPLQEACYFGRYDMVQLLINNGADPNLTWKGIEGSKSPLICAVLSKSETSKDIVKLLLDHNANVLYKDECQKTAYDYATEINNTELLDLLKNDQ